MNSAVNLPPRPGRVHVYAIIRVDTDAAPESPWEHRVTVTKVVPDPDRAAAEVERLNALNGGRNTYYFSHVTRMEADAPTPEPTATPAATAAGLLVQ
jgi:hypothetical protein